MVDYHRTGNMEEHLLNSTSTTSHHLRDLWKSPRGTVLRIQALALVAIIFSFFLAAYGSCRRWSNSWIVQKGFFVAHVLSLSLGTYSLGLMQSSLVKSEMYPIWTVSLFVLFGCIDPVTTYNGLDYKGPLSKLMHLIRCWTSNWARVAVTCAYARDRNKRWKPYSQEMDKRPYWLQCLMRLKLFVATCTNWFDKHLWQDKVGQYSLLPEGRLTFWGKKSRVLRKLRQRFVVVDLIYLAFDRLVRMLGLDYVWEVLWDLLGSDTTNKQPSIRLDDDVKASIISFLSQIETDRLDGNWLSFANKYPFGMGRYLPYFTDPIFHSESDGFRYTSFVMIWHIVTWYCELAVQEQEKQDPLGNVEKRIGCTGTAIGYLEKAAAALTGCCFKKAAAGGGEKEENRRNRHVSNVLSKYCTYLVVSAPELLPGPASETKRAYQLFLKSVMRNLDEDLWEKGERDKPMSYHKIWERRVPYDGEFWYAIDLLKLLLGEDILLLDVRVRSDVWNVLALVWVRMLVYAAPYGNVEVHKGRLSHGGEFITHLWALLYHLDIREWKIPEVQSIATVEDAKRILDDPVISVVAFLYSSSVR